MEVLQATSIDTISSSNNFNESIGLTRITRNSNPNIKNLNNVKSNTKTVKSTTACSTVKGTCSTTSSNTDSSTTTTTSTYTEEMDMEWFAGVAEEELLYYSGINELDSLWTVVGSFVPPPPRPPFLPDDEISSDGLTTCDLCSWAMKNPRYPSSLPGTLEAPGDIGWVLTLVIVSLVSAGIGAVFMVTLLRCRRLKSNGGRVSCCGIIFGRSNQRDNSDRESGVMQTDRPGLELDKLPAYHEVNPTRSANVWSWLGSRRGGGPPGVAVHNNSQHHHLHHLQYQYQYHSHTNHPHPHYHHHLHHHHLNNHHSHHQYNQYNNNNNRNQLQHLHSNSNCYRTNIQPTVENHYTHMQQNDEALYAELDSTHADTPISNNDDADTHYHELTPRASPRYQIKEDVDDDEDDIINETEEILILNNSHQPSYQNTGYNCSTSSDIEQDDIIIIPTQLNSPPSSAYYSDLSSNSNNNNNQQIMHRCTRTIQQQTLNINDPTLSSDYI